MKELVTTIGGNGAGDCLESLVCASYIKKAGKDVITYLCTREEIIKPLRFLFEDQFSLELLPESYGDKFTTNPNFVTEFKKEKFLASDGEFYLSYPDLLFHHPLAFNYKKYNVSLRTLRTTRLLTHKWKPGNKKKIYVGLCSSTDGYLYNNIPALLRKLGKELPDYELIFPNLKSWAKRELTYGDLSNMPQNVTIHENPDFCDSLKIMTECCLGIYTCNGSSHIAFSLGQPRLLLDPQYERIMWQSRWKEDTGECIDINTSIGDIVSIVKTNLTVPETTLLSRQKVLDILIKNNYNVNWVKDLLIKY